jgi:hypothetical protein
MEAIEVEMLVRDLKTTAALLAALKRILRSAGHKTTRLEARDLLGFKARATRLCALRAHLRGRIHLPTMTREDQAALIDEERQLYTRRAA